MVVAVSRSVFHQVASTPPTNIRRFAPPTHNTLITGVHWSEIRCGKLDMNNEEERGQW